MSKTLDKAIKVVDADNTKDREKYIQGRVSYCKSRVSEAIHECEDALDEARRLGRSSWIADISEALTKLRSVEDLFKKVRT